ncbi:MAG TPA: hypothetical protein PKD41_02185 [Solidesulfovibrio sp.]|nr:hypothetical protein [Desulfovibrio sp.]HML59666.1 hypothetical protein [Solidesulfovibrio sp.]
MGKNDWRKKQEEAGGKTISVTLTPPAALALEELKKRLKSSQADIVSRVLVWGLSEVEAGKKPSSDKDSATQEEGSRVAHESIIPPELEARLQAIEERLAKLEPKARGDICLEAL